MEKTIKDHLENAFDGLRAEKFKKFKNKLCNRTEEPRIWRAEVEKLEDAIDLTDVIENTFTTSGAVAVTVEILKAIGCNKQAEDLIKNTGQCEVNYY